MPDHPIVDIIPTRAELHQRIGFLLRELHIARRLFRLAKVTDEYRQINAQPNQIKATAAGVVRG